MVFVLLLCDKYAIHEEADALVKVPDGMRGSAMYCS